MSADTGGRPIGTAGCDVGDAVVIEPITIPPIDAVDAVHGTVVKVTDGRLVVETDDSERYARHRSGHVEREEEAPTRGGSLMQWSHVAHDSGLWRVEADGGEPASGTERNADGDTPDTKQDNECAGEDCSAFVLPGETYCMGCNDALRSDGGTDSTGTEQRVPSSEDYCKLCGSEETIPVWEDPEDFERGAAPDYVGCLSCNEMRSLEEDDGLRADGSGETDSERAESADEAQLADEKPKKRCQWEDDYGPGICGKEAVTATFARTDSRVNDHGVHVTTEVRVVWVCEEHGHYPEVPDREADVRAQSARGGDT